MSKGYSESEDQTRLLLSDAVEKIQELEQQKAELMDIAREYMGYLLSGEIFAFDNENDRKEGERIKELLKNIT